VEEEAAIVADAVPRRELAGEDRRVRRQRQRRRRDRLLEQYALAREAIEVRRRDGVEPVRVNPIRARRIERDDQEVEVGGADAGLLSTWRHRRRPADIPSAPRCGRLGPRRGGRAPDARRRGWD